MRRHHRLLCLGGQDPSQTKCPVAKSLGPLTQAPFPQCLFSLLLVYLPPPPWKLNLVDGMTALQPIHGLTIQLLRVNKQKKKIIPEKVSKNEAWLGQTGHLVTPPMQTYLLYRCSPMVLHGSFTGGYSILLALTTLTVRPKLIFIFNSFRVYVILFIIL